MSDSDAGQASSAGVPDVRRKARRVKRRRGPPGADAFLPRSLDDRTVSRVPRRHVEDAVQEAWVAYLRAKNPNTAVAGYLNLVQRREERCVCFSQLEAEEWVRIYYEMPA